MNWRDLFWIGMVCAFCGLLVFAQGDLVPFPNHEEPPKGWFCSPHARQADHRCACKNMATDQNDPICETESEEDKKCLVYCHKEHCGCKTACSS